MLSPRPRPIPYATFTGSYEARMARATAALRAANASPMFKALDRLARRIKRANRGAFEGYSVNFPHPGEALVHVRLSGAERVSIRVTAGGRLLRHPGGAVTVKELFADAADLSAGRV